MENSKVDYFFPASDLVHFAAQSGFLQEWTEPITSRPQHHHENPTEHTKSQNPQSTNTHIAGTVNGAPSTVIHREPLKKVEEILVIGGNRGVAGHVLVGPYYVQKPRGRMGGPPPGAVIPTYMYAQELNAGIILKYIPLPLPFYSIERQRTH